MSKNWPRLSETLPHVAPVTCGKCGAHYDTGDHDVQLWREHDDHDRPERIFFWLCTKCSSEIIEPHPRLYDCICDNTPAPGAMRICSDCPHRQRTRCPLTLYNGGPGIRVMACAPLTMHIDRRVGGKHVGEWHRSFAIAPSGCTGKTPWPPEPATSPAPAQS